MKEANGKTVNDHGYAPVNGLKMYYEIEGNGDPLVYIPPIFGHAGMKSFPTLAQNHSVITMDLQGHGRTADIPERPITLEQLAKDVVGLLGYLGISKANFLGESYGGAIAMLITVHHSALVRRVATYGATFGPPQIAVKAHVLSPKLPFTPDSGAHKFQSESYSRVAPDPEYWPKLWSKIMRIQWQGFSNEELTSIEVPTLIALGDHDFVRLEHAIETFQLIPNAELAVIPDASHFALFSGPEKLIPVIDHFLTKPERKLPFADADTGYRPGETR